MPTKWVILGDMTTCNCLRLFLLVSALYESGALHTALNPQVSQTHPLKAENNESAALTLRNVEHIPVQPVLWALYPANEPIREEVPITKIPHAMSENAKSRLYAWPNTARFVKS
jgi:hypothetical protein